MCLYEYVLKQVIKGRVNSGIWPLTQYHLTPPEGSGRHMEAQRGFHVTKSEKMAMDKQGRNPSKGTSPANTLTSKSSSLEL